MSESTIHVAIGNSDDRLSQAEWAEFYRQVDLFVRAAATTVHGAWASLPTAPFQNACWAITADPEPARDLQGALRRCAARYRQDSIAWTEAVPQFLVPTGGGLFGGR